MSETRAYNTDNTLSGISFSGASIGDLSYGWDANKNKTSEGISGTMSGYGFDVGTSGYDVEDRLVSWERDDSNLDQSWNLSLVGDWNSYTENASVQNRTHGDTHELLTVAGQAVTHDAKGNQTVIPAILRPGSDPLAMKWDFENKLISADTDNDSVADVTYQWDALGRRVGRDDGTTVTVFVQSGQQTIADYTSGAAASSPTYDYIYASYIDEPVMRSGTGGNRYYHRNQQYSITALTDGSGSIKERYAYSAYGTPTILDPSLSPLAASSESNRYTYTGREFDEALDLYHYRARMYDSAAGRFCSRDPIGYLDGPAQYTYVAGSPATRIDPGGLFSAALPSGPMGLPDDGWDLPKFVWHYWWGGGEPYEVDPEDMQNFIDGSSHSMLLVKNIIGSKISDEHKKSGCGSSLSISGSKDGISFGLDDPRRSEEAVFDDRAILNSGRMNVRWNCTSSTTCCPDGSVASYSWTCSVDMEYTDRFANPTDVKGPWYETPRKKLAACLKRCRSQHGGPKPRGGSPFTNCARKCTDKWPESELPFATAFDLSGSYSTTMSHAMKFNCCD